ncbi:MAG: hypothetical protein E6K14_00990 [Methanobacteriota archaeon]|nr:MAG: hypothetical protein E6K14_00990 [Euryarchaeota archaeon]
MKISAAQGGRPKAYGGVVIPTAPMPKGDRPIVLYPAYFDLGRSRDDGRRVAKRWAVESPTVQEIATAAKALGLEPRTISRRRSCRRSPNGSRTPDRTAPRISHGPGLCGRPPRAACPTRPGRRSG